MLHSYTLAHWYWNSLKTDNSQIRTLVGIIIVCRKKNYVLCDIVAKLKLRICSTIWKGLFIWSSIRWEKRSYLHHREDPLFCPRLNWKYFLILADLFSKSKLSVQFLYVYLRCRLKMSTTLSNQHLKNQELDMLNGPETWP